jgi:hypothetical protein
VKLPYRTRPGLGFVFLVVALVVSTTFFAWGWRTPPLERIWQMQLELVLGDRNILTSAERRLLQDTLSSYPDLANNMLDDATTGWLP